MAGDAPLADQVPQLGRQGRRQPRHGGGQHLAQGPPLGGMAAKQLAATGVKHGRATGSQHRLELLQPGGLQGRQQPIGQGSLQEAMHLGHRQHHPPTGGIRQQACQLGIGQGHVGTHQHQPRQGSGRATPPQTRQLGGAQGLGGQGGQRAQY